LLCGLGLSVRAAIFFPGPAPAVTTLTDLADGHY